MKFLVVLITVGLAVAGCSSVPPTVKAARDAFKHVRAGDDAAGKGDIDTAIKHYEIALDLVPGQARKYRYVYAQLLYLKGLCYDVESHTSLDKTRGWEFDIEIGKFEKLREKLTKEQEHEELEKFKDRKRKALIYFNKARRQLERCDLEYNYSVEDIPRALAVVFFMMEDWENAKIHLRRLLASSRVDDPYKENIRKVIKMIEKHQREARQMEEEKELEETVP